MKPEYANLGWLRHFALVRWLVDEIGRKDDALRAKDAKHATEIAYYRKENGILLNRIAQKNQAGPIHPEEVPAVFTPKPSTSTPRTGLDILSSRQADVDVQAQRSRREREQAQAEQFRAEAQDIIDRELVTK